jgi:hypothetical protein
VQQGVLHCEAGGEARPGTSGKSLARYLKAGSIPETLGADTERLHDERRKLL